MFSLKTMFMKEKLSIVFHFQKHKKTQLRHILQYYKRVFVSMKSLKLFV
jgi:hypothetical protein